MHSTKQSLLAALTFLASAAPAGAEPLQISDIGSFHIGGRKVTLSGLPVREIQVSGVPFPLKIDPNGDYRVEQMYVQYVKLAAPKAKYPLLMLHGGGMTGATWETTPDGRPGWQMYFLRQGHDVYIADAVERGRSGFAPPQVWKNEPVFPGAKGTWELGRVGPPGSYNSDPAKRTAFGKFPPAAFDQLMRQRVPSWGAANARAAMAGFDQLAQRICPCAVIARSSNGPLALRMALNAPDKVKAVVVIEPSGALDPEKEDAAKLKGVPHLWLWGDNVATDPVQTRVMPGSVRWRDALVKAGVTADWIDLPKMGIAGNSHVMMMDSNSDEVAGAVQAWLAKHGLMK
jgi:pimeloyl-ACP methyl ester carboxylesterase